MTGDAGVVHALIEDLAAGKLVGKSQLQLTEEQNNARIPNYLIYLAGLIVKTSSPSGIAKTVGSAQSLTTRDNEEFESLQNIFSEFNDNDIPIFRLSPRLCPTGDQLSSIQIDFERKQTELERKAQQAAEDLLSEELQSSRDDDAKPSSANTKSKAKKKKKMATIKTNSTKIPNQHDNHCEISDSNSHDEHFSPPTTAQTQSTSSTSTLKQVISQIQTETTSSTIEDDSDPSAWIPVSKSKDIKTRKKSASSQSATNQNANMKALSSAGDDNKDQLESSHQAATVMNHSDSAGTPHAGTKSPAALGASGTPSLKDQFLSLDKDTFATKTATKIGEAQKVNIGTDTLDTAETDPLPASVEALSERIRQLEEAVKERDQELQQDKQANAKTLSQKQQQCDDQVQALQLRLYISETRLKTFEEALEHHVQAVASNVSTSIECNSTSGNDTTTIASGRSILHQYSSPKTRWVSQSNQAKDEEPPSPLISRILSRQKK